MGKRKKDFTRGIQKKDIEAKLYEMAMRYQCPNQSVESRTAERNEPLSAAARQMAMDDDAKARWQQGLTEDMKHLILLIGQCSEENASLRESVSDLRDDAAKEKKKVKRLKKELKRNKNDIANLLAIASDQGKCIKKLKNNFNDMEEVTSYIGCFGNICAPNTSIKKQRKAFEKRFQLTFSNRKKSALMDKGDE